MSRETMKTILLMILVVTSIYLTWGIWTFTPNLEKTDQGKYLKPVSTPSSEELGGIIKPYQMIYYNGFQYYGSTSESTISQIITDMSSWDYYDFENISTHISNEKIDLLSHEKGIIEFVFFNRVPFEIYSKVLNIKENDLSEENFDRILVSSKDNRVYFIESNKNHVYYGHVKESSIQALIEQVNRSVSEKELKEYTVLKESAKFQKLYVPAKETDVNAYNYIIDLVSIDKYKDTLFTDPSSVTQESTSHGAEYTDNKSNLLVSDDDLTFSYIKPNFNNNYDVNSSTLLEQSLRFMLEKDSWEKNYRLDYVNTFNKSVLYRLYLNGLPVFSINGMSEIKQIWNKNDIHFFSRPTFTLDFSLPGMSSVTLPAGETVYEQLMEQENFDSDLLECLTIGYKMSRDSIAERMVILEPAWYYKYDGQWKRFTIEDDAGGIANGLE